MEVGGRHITPDQSQTHFPVNMSRGGKARLPEEVAFQKRELGRQFSKHRGKAGDPACTGRTASRSLGKSPS